MYTEQDMLQIRQRIKKYCLILVPLVVALVIGYIACLRLRTQVGAIVFSILIFSTICFLWAMYLYPCIRYSRFLKDMDEGLTREMAGSIVEISDKVDLQDGVRVLPVRIFLEEEQDERIVYLNASKANSFPKPGAKVQLSCFGRHIKEVAVMQ